jgi:hypothetical protein
LGIQVFVFYHKGNGVFLKFAFCSSEKFLRHRKAEALAKSLGAVALP